MYFGIKKYKNIINEQDAKDIENFLMSRNFPFYYLDDITNSKNQDNVNNYGFYHIVYNNDSIQSHSFEKIIPIVHGIQNLINLPIKKILRIRIGLTTKVCDFNYQQSPHVDNDGEHTGFIYYVNNSDGDTLFYDKKYNIIDRCTPIMNTGVLFDGNQYHSGSTPCLNSRRVVINFNLLF